MSNHPLLITFDDEGICSGCRIHEEKDEIDWQERGLKLQSILENYRSQSGTNYDCIVPVSGARDSYFIVHTIKNVYGMNPLLVTYNKQYNTAIGHRNLANLRIQFDCDIMTETLNPIKVKKDNAGNAKAARQYILALYSRTNRLPRKDGDKVKNTFNNLGGPPRTGPSRYVQSFG